MDLLNTWHSSVQATGLYNNAAKHFTKRKITTRKPTLSQQNWLDQWLDSTLNSSFYLSFSSPLPLYLSDQRTHLPYPWVGAGHMSPDPWSICETMGSCFLLWSNRAVWSWTPCKPQHILPFLESLQDAGAFVLSKVPLFPWRKRGKANLLLNQQMDAWVCGLLRLRTLHMGFEGSVWFAF